MALAITATDQTHQLEFLGLASKHAEVVKYFDSMIDEFISLGDSQGRYSANGFARI